MRNLFRKDGQTFVFVFVFIRPAGTLYADIKKNRVLTAYPKRSLAFHHAKYYQNTVFHSFSFSGEVFECFLS